MIKSLIITLNSSGTWGINHIIKTNFLTKFKRRLFVVTYISQPFLFWLGNYCGKQDGKNIRERNIYEYKQAFKYDFFAFCSF